MTNIPPQGLVAQVEALAARLDTLEMAVQRNEARIAALEGWGVAQARNLQAQVRRTNETTRRARWLRTLRR
jgi:DNA polymerase/3'-5' exonuclease PolX